ncbi:tsukushi [Brienomyrus brachyistius]|uniref:tsukushi n=1 Tax=Brienomyrus brachyistius TaxID=42636 RepID=UPI0020B32309|nr:tsukushi [Brienomyrus brachyistius]XP_048837360.1 tsukushi [Brienomyrus brachyistius]XP_048837362.1 tsukushi [Brienomyrus brachyistius]XP_048837363.1 tsukushi [Brienomyrus brachyistius]XP_048837364.1 tsukushi [Brienomyrus brachyistius]
MAILLCVSLSLIFLPHVGSVRNCHPGCRCEVENYGLFDSFSLTKVYCSGVGPSPAPVPIPLDTSFLDLSSNSIYTITDSMLTGPGYTTLVSLDLSRNYISEVHPNAFSKLRYLETLDLSQNSLEDLTDVVFTGLPLTELDLSNNKIQELRLDIFSTKAHGKPISVDLSNNLLAVVSRRVHTSPPNIKSLTLAGNLLRTVPDLRGIPLRYLNLDGNPISSIEKDVFVDLKDLVHLSLSALPKLTAIQPQSFKDLQNLQVLDLSNNPKLDSLNPEIFTGLIALQELNLSESGVMSLPDNILSYVPSIRSLSLGNNIQCWKTQKQGQYHRQVGQTKSGEVLTCDVSDISL